MNYLILKFGNISIRFEVSNEILKVEYNKKLVYEVYKP